MANATQKIVPHLWFEKEARQAAEFYTTVFKDSKIKNSTTVHDTPSGDADVVVLELMGLELMFLSGGPFFKLNEAFSLVVKCDTQEEIDYYWEKLSAVPEAEQCGWLKDKYGVSWQIVPSNMGELMTRGTPEQIARVTQAFLKMKKFDLAALDRAFAG